VKVDRDSGSHLLIVAREDHGIRAPRQKRRLMLSGFDQVESFDCRSAD